MFDIIDEVDTIKNSIEITKNVLVVFDEFITAEGIQNDDEADKTKALCFILRLPRFSSLLFQSIDSLNIQIGKMQNLIDSYFSKEGA